MTSTKHEPVKPKVRLASASRKWDSWSREQRAVALAKDVLALVKSKRAIATPGDFFLPSSGRKIEPTLIDSDARAFLKRKSCNVCAKGALLLAKIIGRDAMTLRDIGCYTFEFGWYERGCIGTDDKSCIHNLSDAFDKQTLDRIEDAFEVCWRNKYKSDKSRLNAIAQRVIENGGTFSVQDLESP